MWKRNELRFGHFAQQNQDSDRSISEEEDLEAELTGNAISLGRLGNNKKVQVLSQLEILKDSYEHHSNQKGLISSPERKDSYHTADEDEDEVEISLSDEGGGFSHYQRITSATHTNPNEGMVYLRTMASISHSDEEIISDDEKINPHILRSTRENVDSTDSTWSEANREVEAMVCLNENPSCPSSHDVFVRENKSSKGGEGRKKVKPKFVFRLHSHKEDLSMFVGDRHGKTSSDNSPPPDEIGVASDEDMDEFNSESQLIFHNKEFEQPVNRLVPFELAHKHDSKGYSVAEFLNSFEESSNQLQGSSVPVIMKRERTRMVLKKNTFPRGDRNCDEDDSLEALDSESPSGSDDNENHQNLKLVIPRRTMADQFHEAFGTAPPIDGRQCVIFPRPLSDGLFGKLQLVMLREKERDTDFLKNLSAETGFNDERVCISVKILTRSLEAKLIVCSCTPVEDGKKSYWESNLQVNMKARTLTIIFNPSICSNVELEVGNLICIQSPWKEVRVKGKDDAIYLCSYFTQVQS